LQAAQSLLATVGILQEQHGQRPVLRFHHRAVAGQVEECRAVGRHVAQRALQGFGRGRDATRLQSLAAGAQTGAQGGEFLVKLQPVALAGVAFLVDQGVGAEDEQAQWPGGGRRRVAVDQTQQAEKAAQVLAARQRGELPRHGLGVVAGVNQQEAVVIALQPG
jgi:hypothetical protein